MIPSSNESSKVPKRLYDQNTNRQCLPLTKDILLRIAAQLRPQLFSYDDINIYAALCVGFTRFRRAGEFTRDQWDPISSPRFHLSRQHVTLTTVTAQSLSSSPPRKRTNLAKGPKFTFPPRARRSAQSQPSTISSNNFPRRVRHPCSTATLALSRDPTSSTTSKPVEE